MRKIVCLTASPTVNGNGAALIESAAKVIKEYGGDVQCVELREKEIRTCKACYGCRKTGVCVQKDDFIEILQMIHEADGIIAAVPVYYNCMAAQAMVFINRFCCTFAYPGYIVGPRKKIGMFLTCTGSEPSEMEHHVGNILTLPSLSRGIEAFKTEVFTDCIDKDTCRNSDEYLMRARESAAWVIEK